jgi:hypothetical protein
LKSLGLSDHRLLPFSHPWERNIRLKMVLRNLKAFASFVIVELALASGANASDRVDMDFFTLDTPHGWHNEWDKGRRLLSSKSALRGVPLLIIEACKSGSGRSCPSTCDLPTIERSGIVADLGISFKPVERSSAYFEYAASDQQVLPDGIMYVSIRLLCGPAGFVYAAHLDMSSAQKARQDLEAVLNTIKWTK